MKLNISKKIILLGILVSTTVHCDQIITFFFKPFPQETDQKKAAQIAEKRAKKIGKLGKLQKYTLRAATKQYPMAGIFSTYDGYLDISDLNGQILFPRKHKPAKVTIVITKHIVPILMLENTVHHWEISKRDKAKMYEIERKLDTAAKTYFWDTKEVDIPADNIISTDALVIIAKPKHVYIPAGITITTKNPQLVLPDIYIKRGIEKLSNTLYVFDLKNLLMPIDFVYKKGKKKYSHMIRE